MATSTHSTEHSKAARLGPLSRSHYLQRIQLELTLETLPRDSRYSNTLIDLMKREETALQDGAKSAMLKDLIARVDEALKQETKHFFEKSTQQNCKRWTSLLQKLDRERENFRGDLVINKTADRNRDGKISLELESRRLEEDYNRNWFYYEGFHLREAFKSQATRVDVDWSTHEQALSDDYHAKRSALLGEHSFQENTRDVGAEDNGRWHHPEKQKTLIHTAPVLTPMSKDSGSGFSATVRNSRSRGGCRDDAAASREV